MESRILGAPSLFDSFLLNPLIQGHFGSAPKAFRNAFNQATGKDDFRCDPYPEARVSHSQTTQVFDPDDTYDTGFLVRDCMCLKAIN